MNTFQYIESQLLNLESRNFDMFCRSFSWTPENASCLSGRAQFFALDKTNRGLSDRLPVICAVGINYTQEQRRSGGSRLVHFLAPDDASVIDNNAGSRRAIGYILAAYNRNRLAWSNVSEATGLMSSDPRDITDKFILVMTNILPFITQEEWQVQIRRTSNACENLVFSCSTSHLHNLFNVLGDSIDLWIGHSSIHGTKWVWPTFADFVKRHSIREWLLTGNISPRSHLYFDGSFRKRTHYLFPWYGPERQV